VSPVVSLEWTGRSVTVSAPSFRLEIRETEPTSAPYAVLSDPAGREWTEGDADPGRLHAVFSPPPLALGLSRSAAGTPTQVPDGDWLGLWLRAPVHELTFPALRYDPVDSGFLLRLDYEGRTVVDDSWTSPVLVLRPAPTIVIDDRWQAEYGTATVDETSWPDLAGWIAGRHAAGQRVLLWWKAWDPEGIPAEECIRDAGGRAVSVDPSNPAYREHLTAIVRELLSPDGLDADGFKVDFTQRAPSGMTLTAHGAEWGIAALHGQRVPVVDQLEFRHAIANRVLPHHPIDTDQWPMPNRAEWLRYAEAQIAKGVPALYYLESIDRSGEHIDSDDLRQVAATWRRYREARTR
jgi:hypothetical protein